MFQTITDRRAPSGANGGSTLVHSEIVRPRMRTDISFLETEDGVYVQGNGDPFVVRGPSAYRYLSALLPHLDGSTTLADLLAGLPAAHAATIRSLITALASRGVINDAPERSAVLDAWTRSRFGGQIA